MSNSTKYCKVVSNDLKSITREDRDENCIQYEVGNYVYANKGQFLFVFDSLESAKKAIDEHMWESCRIFECECEGLQKDPPYFLRQKYPNGIYPYGTCFAYGVTLTQEIVTKPFNIYLVFTDNGKYTHTSCHQVLQDGSVLIDVKTRDKRKGNFDNNVLTITDLDGNNLREYHFDTWCKTLYHHIAYVTKDKNVAEALAVCLEAGLEIKTSVQPNLP